SERHRNTNRPRILGKGKRKGNKGSKHPSTAHTGKPPVLLGTLLTPTRGLASWIFNEVGTRLTILGGGPIYGQGSDSAESCRDQPDYEKWHSDVDSAGCYSPYLEDYRGYAGYEEKGECSDVSLQSDMGSVREGNIPMKVEEDPHRDLPSHSDAKGSGNDEPSVPKAPPKALPGVRCLRASSLPWVASREVSSEEDTPLPKVKGPRAHAPMPKPRGGKKAATPLPALEPGNTAGAVPNAHAPKSGQPSLPKMAKDSPPQAGQSPNQPMTCGLAGVPSPFPGLFNMCGVVHVPVPVMLNVPVTLSPFVSVPIPVSVCVPVSVIVLIPVLPLLSCSRWPVVGYPALLYHCLALVSGPQPDRLVRQELRPWWGGSVT
ncbi:hypothetical protein P4O66_015688, partial [Electrophorus voltai]